MLSFHWLTPFSVCWLWFVPGPGSRPCFFFLPAARLIAPWRGALWSAKSHRSPPMHHASIPLSIRKIWWPGSSGWSLGKCEMLLREKAPGRGGEDIKTVARTPISSPRLKITPEQTTTITQTPEQVHSSAREPPVPRLP